jgi:hypothetical protein
MQNLEQIRARNALDFSAQPLAGQQGGDVIKNLPHQIMNHGLLAVAAFGFAENQQAVGRVFDAIAKHLADKDVAIVDATCTDRSKLMQFLTRKETTSETLKLATAEAMAWLAYAKRFVKKG